MTKKGQAGQAMGAQLAASAFGGVVGAFVLALFIALFSVSWQALQAASANPVDSLRTE